MSLPEEPTKTVTIESGIVFEVPERLDYIRTVGSGAYGTVAAFRDTKTNQKVAIKKIQSAYGDLIDAKRILREIKVLSHLHHENIIQIMDLFPPKNPNDEDIYIVTDLMETDLHKVIYSKQDLTDEHFQYFVYQILRGLYYLHSANVLHRDLKPSNILVNKNCDLKICDLGLARGLGEKEDDPELTDYVVTRWYRAPEVVLDASHYGRSVDVWAVGCILCELLGRKALFTGRDHIDQLKSIVSIIGTPSEENMAWLPVDGPARKFLAKLPYTEPTPLEKLFPKANPMALDLVKKMFHFNPSERITVKEALHHPYVASLHCPEDEPAGTPIDWAFDKFHITKRELQNRIYMEAAKRHPHILVRDANWLEICGMDVPASLRERGEQLAVMYGIQPVSIPANASELCKLGVLAENYKGREDGKK